MNNTVIKNGFGREIEIKLPIASENEVIDTANDTSLMTPMKTNLLLSLYRSGYNLVFMVNNRVISDTNDIVDTGIPLLKNDKSFILELGFQCDEDNNTNAAVFHCMDETDPYPGICLQSINKKFQFSFWTKRLQTSIAYNDNSNTHSIIVSHDEGSNIYKCVIDGMESTVEITPQSLNNSLLVGGYKDADGVLGRVFKGEIKYFRLYIKGDSND